MSELLVCAEGGLANRLRVLASALAVQDQWQCLLTGFWSLRAGELHAPFDQLFEPVSGLKIADTPSYINSLRPALSRHFWRRQLLNALNRRHGIGLYLYEDSSHPGAIEAALPEARSFLKNVSNAPVLIRTWQGFGTYYPFLRFFKPIKPLQNRIESLVPPAVMPPIGIHVRRGDHRAAIRFSPLESFFIAVDSNLRMSPESPLLLCSDDANVREAFLQRYGDQVIISSAQLSRSSTEAIQDAVVDLFCLARCSLVLGSYHSSFSELAAMIGNCPLHTVGLD